MTRREIQRKFDEITAFAEVEKFIDTPVKHFSSGMYMRLAFAVAAHLEPEILLVDEVLAVGDTQFQEKCLGKMNAAAHGGRTVLFVSHNLGAISKLCTQTFWMDAGVIRSQGLQTKLLSEYLTSTTALEGRFIWEDGIANPGETAFRLDAISIQNQQGEVTSKLDVRRPFSIEIHYRLLQRLPFGRVGFLLSTALGVTVFEAYDADDERLADPASQGVSLFGA